MASRSLGTLTLDLVAKIGGFTAGLDKASRDADKRAKEIERSLLAIGTAANAVGTAIGQYINQGINAALNAFPALIDQVSKFQDIAEKTGASAQGLADFAVAAGVAGTDLETIGAASVKLTKNLTGVTDDSKAAGAALKALGIPIKEFKALAPEDQMLRLSDALAKFQEGAGKTAVAVDLLGKSGADLLPFLKTLSEVGKQRILTDEQIQAADNYADQVARTKTELTLMAGAAATQVIPTVSALTKLMSDLAKETLGVNDEASKLGVNNGVRVFAQSAGEFIANMLDYFKTSKAEFKALTDFFVSTGQAAAATLKGNFAEASRIADEYQKRNGLDNFGRKIAGDAGKEAGRTYVQQFKDQLAAGARTAFAVLDPRRVDKGANGLPKDPRGQLNYSGANTGGGSKDDPTKKLLDNELKELDRFIKDQQDLLAERNKFLDLYNQQGLISIKDYYTQQQSIRDEATQNQIKAYDAQIEALRKYQASATKETDKAEAQGKINDLLDKQAKLQRDAGNAALEAGIKQQQAAKSYQDSLGEINAKILELNGNLGAAALIRFDKQYEQIKKLAEVSGDFASVEQIGRLREYEKAQADINAAQQKFSLIQGDLQIAEERITIARERGTIGEIDALVKSGKERQKAIALLDQQLQKLLAINDAVRTDEQKQAIERLKLQLESLKATVDPLADRFNTLFSDSLGDAFADFVTGTKTAKEAFKDFANTVIKEITRMVAKNVASQLASGLFGGSSGDSGGGFNFGSLLSSLFGGGKATGGPVQPNKLYRVNENGPELFEAANGSQFLMTGTESGKIIPNGAIRASGGQVVNVNIQGYVQRQTPSQIAMEVRRQSNISASRLGPR